MTIKWIERRNSGNLTSAQPSYTQRFTASGENDRATVYAYALAATPAIIAAPNGFILYRQDLLCEPDGFKLFRIEVPYGVDKHDTGSYQLSFDTTGGTVHITSSKQTVAAFGPGTAIGDHGQSIGVTGPDKDPDGADITIPVLKLTATFRHPAAIITLPQIKFLSQCTGRVNNDTFLTFAPGEVLFLGCTGQEGSDSPTEVQYHFACSQNLAGLTVGAISGISKLGHHLYWIQYKPSVSNNAGTRIPKGVYVERVYDFIPMALSLGFGG